MIKKFKGCIPALLSPTDDSGRLNLKILPRYLKFLVDRGAGGIFVAGSSGEGFFLTAEERKSLADACVKELAGQIPVVVHVGAMDLRMAEDLARHAGRIGAAGVSSVMPFYYGYSLAEARLYYETIARAAGLPLIIYVYSGSSTVKFTPESFVETMTKIPGLYGLKYTAMTLHEMQIMQQLSDGRLRTFGGWDELALPYLVMGCVGVIGTNYSYMPEPVVALCRAVAAGDLPRAMRLQARITDLLRQVADISPVERAKAGCWLRGLDLGHPRRPMSWPSPQRLAAFRAALRQHRLGRI
jgi:N-acetylneuraminate lyase